MKIKFIYSCVIISMLTLNHLFAIFTTPQTVSEPITDPEISKNPKMVQSQSGKMKMLWAQKTNSSPARSLILAGNAPNKDWYEPPKVVTESIFGLASFDIAEDFAGNLTIAWIQEANNGQALYSAFRPVDQSDFNPPILLREALSLRTIRLAAGPKNGFTIATWEEKDEISSFFKQYGAVSTNGQWNDIALLLDSRSEATHGRVASSINKSIVCWEESDRIFAVVRSTNWEPAVSLIPIGEGSNPSVVMNKNDEAIITFQGSLLEGVGPAAVRYINSTFELPQILDPTTGDNPIKDVRAAIDDAGNGLAIWKEISGRSGIIQASQLFNGSWVPLGSISKPEDNSKEPDISMNGEGNAVVVWRAIRTDNTNIIKTRVFIGGSFLTEQRVSTASVDAKYPVGLIGKLNNTVISWQAQAQDNFLIQSARSE